MKVFLGLLQTSGREVKHETKGVVMLRVKDEDSEESIYSI